MNFTKLSLTIAAIAACCSSYATDNSKGIEFYKAGLTNTAKNIFLNNLKGGAVDSAEACYYLGEIYYDINKPDSASLYYKMGLASNPEYAFNTIGLAKLTLKSNPEEAGKTISAVLKSKTGKKNAALWVAAGEAYFLTGASKEIVQGYIDKAKSINQNYADAYVLEGDMYAAAKDYGNASSLYEQAVYFDPHCYHAYLKGSRIYSSLNIQSSIDMMKKLMEVNPKSPIAVQELAELYYKNGQIGKAKEVYAEHVKSEYSSVADNIRYANILFFAHDYEQSLSFVKEMMLRDPENPVLQRLLMYNLYELKDYTKGLAAAKHFMKTANPNDFITNDYVYAARLLEENNEHQTAVDAYKKALEMDSARIDLYKELESVYEKMVDYPNAINTYGTYINKIGDKVTATDYFNFGKVYYYAGYQLDSTAANKELKLSYYKSADSLFQKVSTMVPDSYLGSFWQGRVNALIDANSELGLAKQYYETAATLLEKDNNNIQSRIECYRYLGYYYYIKEDTANSKIYWNKILALEPTNELALTALKGMQ